MSRFGNITWRFFKACLVGLTDSCKTQFDYKIRHIFAHDIHSRCLANTNKHTQRGMGKTDYSVAGEGVTKRAASGPFGTFCHHVVTKRAAVTKRAGSASNLIPNVTKRAATGPNSSTAYSLQIRS